MDRETLYCLKGHRYDGVWRNPGEEMEVRKNHIKVLIALKRATREAPNVIQFPALRVPASEIDREGRGGDFTPETVYDTSETVNADREALRAEFKAKFGKSAPGRMSDEKIRELIAGKGEGE